MGVLFSSFRDETCLASSDDYDYLIDEFLTSILTKGNESEFENDKWTDDKGPGYEWTVEEQDI